MSQLHRDVLEGDQHIIHQWTFADATARDAATYVSADVGKVARVGASEPYTFFILAGLTPLAWEAHGGLASPLSAALDFNNKDADNMKTASFAGVINKGDVSGAVNIDWSQGSLQRVRLTGSTTLTESNSPGPGRYQLLVVQDGTGSHTLTTWLTKKPGGNITITGTANAEDILTFLDYGSFGWYVMAGNDWL